MDEYPGNSRSIAGEPALVEQSANGNGKIEPKKVERVVTGEVIRRKPGLGKRLKETFIGGEAKNVAQYVMFDVLVPALRDTISDVISQGVERMLYGENMRAGGRRSSNRPSSGGTYVAYNRFSSPTRRDPREEPREISRRARAAHDFDEIIFPTRAEAEDVKSGMFDLITRYEQVTVADFYNLAGVTPSYTDEAYGWNDIQGTKVARERNGGYIIDTPPVEHLGRR